LDIKTPLALSALDYLEKIPRFKKLIDHGVITLPDSLSEIYFGEKLPQFANVSKNPASAGGVLFPS